jgi:hypothetical protein
MPCQQLRRLIEADLNAASFRKALTALTGEASRWPGDEEFRRQWLDGSVYPGRLDAPKLRTVFHRLETEIRTEKTEEPIPLALDSLDIDHILPQSGTPTGRWLTGPKFLATRHSLLPLCDT